MQKNNANTVVGLVIGGVVGLVVGGVIGFVGGSVVGGADPAPAPVIVNVVPDAAPCPTTTAAEVPTAPPTPPTPDPTQARLQLNTGPFAKTFIDGREHGFTPFLGPRTLTLPIGAHTLVFETDDAGVHHQYEYRVDLPTASTSKLILVLDKDEAKTEGDVMVKRVKG